MRKGAIITLLIIAFVLFPKPYDRVGGVAGNQPGPWKCWGISFWTGGGAFPDAMSFGSCVGIPYK